MSKFVRYERLDGTLLCPVYNGELRAHWSKDGLAFVHWYHTPALGEFWQQRQKLVPQEGVQALYSVLKAKIEGSGVLLGGAR